MDTLFNKTHLMLDLETLSARQDAAIISIGATIFTFENGISDEFLMNISVKDASKYNRSITKDTLLWWKQQPSEVWKSVTTNSQTLPDVLNAFNEFASVVGSKGFLWANGAAFDFGIVRGSYEACGIERSWKHWQELDLRTMSTVLGIKLSSGNNHNALDDAKNQTRQLIEMFKDE